MAFGSVRGAPPRGPKATWMETAGRFGTELGAAMTRLGTGEGRVALTPWLSRLAPLTVPICPPTEASASAPGPRIDELPCRASPATRAEPPCPSSGRSARPGLDI